MKMPDFIRERIEKHRDREFLKAAMAACALTAYADGKVSYSERHKVEDILECLRWLLVEDANKAMETFESFVTALEDNTLVAEKVLLGKLRRMAADPEAADLIVHIALEVIHADDHFNRAERLQLTEICHVLGLNAEDYGRGGGREP